LQFTASEKALANNPNCPWTWVIIKQKFNTVADAKSWLNENRAEIIDKLYFENGNSDRA